MWFCGNIYIAESEIRKTESLLGKSKIHVCCLTWTYSFGKHSFGKQYSKAIKTAEEASILTPSSRVSQIFPQSLVECIPILVFFNCTYFMIFLLVKNLPHFLGE